MMKNILKPLYVHIIKFQDHLPGKALFWGLLVVSVLFGWAEEQVNAETIIETPITASITWEKDKSPYVVTQSINVGSASDDGSVAILTIEPGVEVTFQQGTGLYIGDNSAYPNQYAGALQASGTEAEPIVFTSESDTSFWNGISFQALADSDASILQHVTVERGGDDGWNGANISCISASPEITESRINFGKRHGIYLDASHTRINNSEIKENGRHGIYVNNNSSPAIEFNRDFPDKNREGIVRNGRNGINIYDSEKSVTFFTFFLPFPSMRYIPATFSGSSS